MHPKKLQYRSIFTMNVKVQAGTIRPGDISSAFRGVHPSRIRVSQVEGSLAPTFRARKIAASPIHSPALLIPLLCVSTSQPSEACARKTSVPYYMYGDERASASRNRVCATGRQPQSNIRELRRRFQAGALPSARPGGVARPLSATLHNPRSSSAELEARVLALHAQHPCWGGGAQAASFAHPKLRTPPPEHDQCHFASSRTSPAGFA